MTEDILSIFYEIVRKDPNVKRSLLSHEKLTEIFTECVSKIKYFYQEAKYIPQDEYIDTMKVYLRLYKPTGHYYIGYTQQYSVARRHRQDLYESFAERKQYRLVDFYRHVLDTDDDFEDNFLLFVLTEVDSVATAKIIEEKLIQHFTEPTNETSLPIELCLNTEHVYNPHRVIEKNNDIPRKIEKNNNIPRKILRPNIVDLSSVTWADVRKCLANH